MQLPKSPWVTNSDPEANPHFLNSLRSAGVLDTSYIFDTGSDVILNRYQSGLEAAHFAEHATQFCQLNEIKLTAQSNIGFFHEDPTPSRPFVRLFVDRLPHSHWATEVLNYQRAEGATSWTMVDTEDVEPGKVEYVVQVPKFLHIFVVFEVNNARTTTNGLDQESEDDDAKTEGDYATESEGIEEPLDDDDDDARDDILGSGDRGRTSHPRPGYRSYLN